jgi:hypothetical protein
MFHFIRSFVTQPQEMGFWWNLIERELPRNYLCAWALSWKRSENSKILRCLHMLTTKATMIGRNVNKFTRKLLKMSRLWNFFVRVQNYYKLWHFYWVSGDWHEVSFGFLLAVFQFRKIKLSRWKKSLKISILVVMLCFFWQCKGEIRLPMMENIISYHRSYRYQLKIIYSFRWQQQIEIMHQEGRKNGLTK